MPDAMANAYEPAPPLADKICEYGIPRKPAGKLPITEIAGQVVAVSATDGDPPLALETVSVALFAPGDVG